FAAQPEERRLDDVAGGVQIVEQPFRVTEQRPLIFGQRLDDPLRCRPHGVPSEDNGPALIFLDGNIREPKRLQPDPSSFFGSKMARMPSTLPRPRQILRLASLLVLFALPLTLSGQDTTEAKFRGSIDTANIR